MEKNTRGGKGKVVSVQNRKRIRKHVRILNRLPTGSYTPAVGKEDPMSASPIHVVSVLSVKSSVPSVVRFLGPIRGCLSHWTGKRSYLCAGVGKCPKSVCDKQTNWKGYAPVQLWRKAESLWTPEVLEVTESLEEVLRSYELRGSVYLLTRDARKDGCGTVRAVYCETREQIPEAFDIVPVLQRLFRQSDFLIDVPNATIPPTLLPASHDSGPIEPNVLKGEGGHIDKDAARAFRERRKNA